MTALDSAVGDIMETLRLEGLEENTVVLFSSDNGGAGAKYNKPLRGRKEFLYEGGTRVVSLLSGPGLPSTLYPGMVHVTDWFATFMSLAGQRVLFSEFCLMTLSIQAYLIRFLMTATQLT